MKGMIKQHRNVSKVGTLRKMLSLKDWRLSTTELNTWFCTTCNPRKQLYILVLPQVVGWLGFITSHASSTSPSSVTHEYTGPLCSGVAIYNHQINHCLVPVMEATSTRPITPQLTSHKLFLLHNRGTVCPSTVVSVPYTASASARFRTKL